MTRLSPYLFSALLFIADQLSKWFVLVPLRLREVGQVPVLPPLLNATYVENHGISLGMLTADSATERWLLVLVTAAISALILRWIAREPNAKDRLALGAILGGALGNIVDRVRLGYVVDFVDLMPFNRFFIFNVADAAISLGVVALVVRSFWPGSTSSTAKQEEPHHHA